MQTMTVKVADNELRIDVESLINSLPEGERTKVAKLIGADIHAWRQMAEAIADPAGFYNGDECWWFGREAMLEVREKLLPLAPENARHAAEELQRQLDEAKADVRRNHRWAWAMYHAHRDIMAGRTSDLSFPEIPTWAPTSRDEMRVRDAAPEMRAALDMLSEQIKVRIEPELLEDLGRASVGDITIRADVLLACLRALRAANREE